MFYRITCWKKFRMQKISKRVVFLSFSITWERFIDLQMKVDARTGGLTNLFIFAADVYEGLMCSFTELMSNHKNPMVAY